MDTVHKGDYYYYYYYYYYYNNNNNNVQTYVVTFEDIYELQVVARVFETRFNLQCTSFARTFFIYGSTEFAYKCM